MAESSTKPYMLRALHEWCTDNGYTPQIVVQVDANTLVPPAHVRDGQITLNIGALATNRLVIGNEAVEFQARFSGITENLYVPIANIVAIYARETGAGMGFEAEPSTSSIEPSESFDLARQDETVSPDTDGPKPPENKRPKLSIVK
ncbi:ClpXP protease specificity-enhancing factor [Zwartia sp.]|uniref:ClpXP protease specificity-enhancing factor n=1 Tax=Zwartia sp. TaxID=2978004 RepID=UPI003BAE93F8